MGNMTQSTLQIRLLTPSPGVSLTEKKKSVPVSQKSPRALHVLNHGWWQLAVGGWRRLAVGSWQLAVGGGWWWLAAVGGWRLVVGGSWQWLAVGGWSPLAVGGGWWRLVVGGWWQLAVDGSWRLAVGGPLGRSLRAVLSKKKKSRPLRTPLPLAKSCPQEASALRDATPRHLFTLKLPLKLSP